MYRNYVQKKINNDIIKDPFLAQTMIRVRDPRESLKFYTGVMGMRLLKKMDFSLMEFTVYFLGYHDLPDIPQSDPQLKVWLFSQKATLTLTHNWGSECDPKFSLNTGNEESHKGFSHIGISVPDFDAAMRRFKDLDVKVIEPSEESVQGCAYILDPDGYYIEIVNASKTANLYLSSNAEQQIA